MSEAAPLPRPEAPAAYEVRILYTNWRGETAPRRLRLQADRLGRLDLLTVLWFGATEWHPEPQWLLTALDIEKGELRDFAMSGVKAWGDAAVEAALLEAAAGNAALLARAPPAQRMSLAGFVSALDIASLKADSPDDASALRAAADLVQNYDVEIGAALAAGAGSWAAWSETEVDSDPSDPLCGRAEVWRVGWWRRGAAHADIEHEMGGPDGERRARALAVALNGLHAVPLAPPAPAAVEGEVSDPVRRERAACAYLAECHTGLWDNATAVAIAGAIRERGRDSDDGVLVSPEAWAAVQPVWLLLRHGTALPAELEARIRAALPVKPAFRTGDIVRHVPTDETWTVAYADPVSGVLAWCGYPNGASRVAECELIEAAGDGLHRAILAEVLACGDQRASVARRLYGEPSAPADLTTSAPPEVRHG